MCLIFESSDDEQRKLSSFYLSLVAFFKNHSRTGSSFTGWGRIVDEFASMFLLEILSKSN